MAMNPLNSRKLTLNLHLEQGTHQPDTEALLAKLFPEDAFGCLVWIGRAEMFFDTQVLHTPPPHLPSLSLWFSKARDLTKYVRP